MTGTGWGREHSTGHGTDPVRERQVQREGQPATLASTPDNGRCNLGGGEGEMHLSPGAPLELQGTELSVSVFVSVCAHTGTCVHTLPPGARDWVPTVLVPWGPTAFAVNSQPPGPGPCAWRSTRTWGPGPDTRVLLLGGTQHSVTLPQTTGLSRDRAWDTVTVGPCAPWQPET